MGCGGGGSSSQVEETAYEKELSKITEEEWSRYKSTYQPLFNDLADKISAWGTNEQNTVKGKANAQLTSSYTDVMDTAKKSVAARGLDPSSMGSAIENAERNKSSGKTQSYVTGENNVTNAKTSGLQTLANMARGDAGDAIQGISSLASDSVSAAINKANAEQQAYSDKVNAIAGLAGIGVGAAKNSDIFSSTTKSTTPSYGSVWT